MLKNKIRVNNLFQNYTYSTIEDYRHIFYDELPNQKEL